MQFESGFYVLDVDGQRMDAPCSGWLAAAGAGPSEAALRDARAAADAEGGAVGGAEDLRARLGARTGTAQRARNGKIGICI